MRIVLYDTGIGGLAALRESIVLVPDTEWFFVADEDVFPSGHRSAIAIDSRLRAVSAALVPLAPDLVVPVASFAWPHLSSFDHQRGRVVDPVVRIAADVATRRPAAVGLIGPSSVVQGDVSRRIVGDAASASVSSLAIAGVAERGGPRDELVADIVRDSVAQLRTAGVSLVVPLDSHAALVADFIKRSSGGADVVDTPRLVAEAVAADAGRRSEGVVSDPHVTILTPPAFQQKVRQAAIEHLQLPKVDVAWSEIGAGTEHSAPSTTDVALLAYAAFDAGAHTELARLVTPEARHLSNSAPLLAWLSATRATSRCEHVIDEVLTAGDIVGVAGTRKTPSGPATAFAHRLRVIDGRIVDFDVVDVPPLGWRSEG